MLASVQLYNSVLQIMKHLLKIVRATQSEEGHFSIRRLVSYGEQPFRRSEQIITYAGTYTVFQHEVFSL